MLTGAWIVIYFGRPRASHDIDFVVEVDQKNLDKLLRALRTLSSEYIVQEETVREAAKKRGMFNVIYLPTYLKLDFWMLQAEEFDRTRFSRRVKVNILNQSMMIATAEDAILQKLRWYKQAEIEKHLVDAAFVYQIQNKNLDQKYLKKWAEKLKVDSYLAKLKKIDLEKYL